MGIWPRCASWGVLTAAAGAVALARRRGARARVNEVTVRCATGLSELRADLGARREGGHGGLSASNNGECHCGRRLGMTAS